VCIGVGMDDAWAWWGGYMEVPYFHASIACALFIVKVVCAEVFSEPFSMLLLKNIGVLSWFNGFENVVCCAACVGTSHN